MTAQNIVETVTRKGFSLWLTAGKLMVRPKADDATRELLRQHKAGIISFLSGGNPDEGATVPENKKSTSFFGISSQEPHREERRDPAGEMPPASEIVAPCSPNAKQTAGEAADELRTERAAIKEFSGNLPQHQAELEAVQDVPCYNCDGRTFWVSTYGVIVCGRCHPPATPKLVARWITIPNELGDDEN